MFCQIIVLYQPLGTENKYSIYPIGTDAPNASASTVYGHFYAIALWTNPRLNQTYVSPKPTLRTKHGSLNMHLLLMTLD